MTIDVFIANVFSKVYFDYSLSFSLFFQFFPFVCKKKIYYFYFFVLGLSKYVSQNKLMFFGDVMVSCMTAGLGFKMAASNSKWRVCDVIVTSKHVIIDTS